MNPLPIPPVPGLPLGGLLDAFPDWFQGLSLGTQVLVGLGLALSLALSILVIIAVAWLVYQLVKAAIVGSVIAVYFSIACVVLLFILIYDPRAASETWNKVAADIKWFARKAYQKNQYPRPVPRPPSSSSAPRAPSEVPRARSAGCRPGALRVEVPSTPLKAEEASRAGPFCTECGLSFTSRMQKVLAARDACFCEACGQAFETTDGKIIPVLVAG